MTLEDRSFVSTADSRREMTPAWTYLILSGALLFIVALTGSAIAVPQLRLLHTLQALIYVTVIVLGLRGDAAGLGAGVSVPIAWNYLQLFITGLMRAGAGEFWSLVRSGRATRVDTMFVFVGGIGHFLLIAGCLGAMIVPLAPARSWKRFVLGAVVALAYFGTIVATALPR